MESNGKHVALEGKHVETETGPIYWGDAKHSSCRLRFHPH
jgi:glucose-6-phosphate isomerase